MVFEIWVHENPYYKQYISYADFTTCKNVGIGISRAVALIVFLKTSSEAIAGWDEVKT